MKTLTYLIPLIFLLALGCTATRGLNVFSLEQDLQLGKQTDQEIRNTPQEFPILSRSANPQAYAYLQGMVDEIVRQGNVPHAEIFPYTVTIINKDVQNAFATAGGYLYVYTGLIKFIDTEDELAGILAHEIAHAAERHITEQATKQYGLSTLIALVTDNPDGTLTQVGTSLIGLSFSRGSESEADARSVDYLCNSKYAANGAAGFFEKTGNANTPPEFLSTHPSPTNRVQDINDRAQAQSCSVKASNSSTFRTFQRSL